MVFLARTMRWAIVASVDRKARAISSVVDDPQGESRAGVGRQDGVAGREEEAQQLVAEIIVRRGGKPAPAGGIRRRRQLDILVSQELWTVRMS
jgi:hypothetical protein